MFGTSIIRPTGKCAVDASARENTTHQYRPGQGGCWLSAHGRGLYQRPWATIEESGEGTMDAAMNVNALKAALCGELGILRQAIDELAAPLSEEQFWRKP